MNNFSEEFQGFIDDMLNDIIEDLREKNLEYSGYIKYLKENSDKINKTINKLSEAERKLINEYESNYFNKIAIEQGEFYYRGYRDCVKLLKWLRMI